MKKLKLSFEEQTILRRLSREQLAFLQELSEHKHFAVLTDVINFLIDQEKNVFFSEREVDPMKLAVLHHFSRGGIAKLVMLVHLIVGAKHELAIREKERKKRA